MTKDQQTFEEDRQKKKGKQQEVGGKEMFKKLYYLVSQDNITPIRERYIKKYSENKKELLKIQKAITSI